MALANLAGADDLVIPIRCSNIGALHDWPRRIALCRFESRTSLDGNLLRFIVPYPEQGQGNIASTGTPTICRHKGKYPKLALGTGT